MECKVKVQFTLGEVICSVWKREKNAGQMFDINSCEAYRCSAKAQDVLYEAAEELNDAADH